MSRKDTHVLAADSLPQSDGYNPESYPTQDVLHSDLDEQQAEVDRYFHGRVLQAAAQSHRAPQESGSLILFSEPSQSSTQSQSQQQSGQTQSHSPVEPPSAQQPQLPTEHRPNTRNSTQQR